jgi:hypothetical protein
MLSDAGDEALVGSALTAATRAPSAHNAQPWRLSPLPDGKYLLWYAFADRLLADPDDRDGIMAVGGFYETLRLSAEAVGLETELELEPAAHATGINIGVIAFTRLQRPPDPLAAAIHERQCNRHPYSMTPIPSAMADSLEALGNVLLPPHRVADLVARASVMAWKDTRFVSDLEAWTRFDDHSPDGMTVDCLQLSAVDQAALRFALRRGRLPGALARVYAQRDVRLTRASGAVAVLVTNGRGVDDLFQRGRDLVRSWTLVNSLGYSWHPMSIVIDQPTVASLRARIGGQDPVAIYRVGHTPLVAAWSRRRSLDAVLVSRPAQALGTI